MKKFKFYLLMAIAALSCGVLTSCDEDVDEAGTLSGEWRGDFGMSYTDSRGRVWDSYDTYIVFYQDSPFSSHGWGKQVDYYYEGPCSRQYFRFNWRVRNGVVHISYPYNHDLDVDIYNYQLYPDYFAGRFESGTRFRLNKLVDTYDWGYYDRYDSYYGWYDTYYYAKSAGKRNDTASSAEEPTDSEPAVVVRNFNRYN